MISRSDFDRTIELNLKSVFLYTPLNHRIERRNGVQLKALTLLLETSVRSEAEADGQGAPRFDRASTAATDILQLRGGSRVFLNEWVFVSGSRCVGFNRRRLVLFWRRRRIVTSEPLACPLDRATVRSSGTRALRACAERQHDDNRFHSNSFVGNIARRVCATGYLNQRPMEWHSTPQTRQVRVR